MYLLFSVTVDTQYSCGYLNSIPPQTGATIQTGPEKPDGRVSQENYTR